MSDVVNREENLGALDDLSKIANGSKSTLEFVSKLNDFENGLEAAKLAIRQTSQEQELAEAMTGEEILRAVQRDIAMYGNPKKDNLTNTNEKEDYTR